MGAVVHSEIFDASICAGVDLRRRRKKTIGVGYQRSGDWTTEVGLALRIARERVHDPNVFASPRSANHTPGARLFEPSVKVELEATAVA